MNDRLDGFTVDTADRNQSPWVGSREVKAFPDFYAPQLKNVHTRHTHFLCTGPVTYKGGVELKADLDNLKAALKAVDVTEAFVPATSVSSIEDWNRNVFYKTDEEYLFALAEAMFVFWFAYRTRWYGYNRLGDYSYGLYLWGFPMQQVVAHHVPAAMPLANAALALPLAAALAVVSWHSIEKPALSLKSMPRRLLERLAARAAATPGGLS